MITITKDTPLRMIRELGKECKMCGNCCSHGSGLLVNEDLARLARLLQIKEKELKKTYLDEVEMFNTKALRPRAIKGNKQYGPCIFYDKKKGCTIHIAKPFQCLITNCGPYAEQIIQWFYLNYLVNPDDPESVRQWASYLEHKEWVIEGGNLHQLVPDAEKLRKILSYEILR